MNKLDTWYVAYGPDKTIKSDGRAAVAAQRATRTFPCEATAKSFAMEVLEKGWTASAGTLNPHLPKQIIGPAQIETWAYPRLTG